jgi:hypothetical protein
MSFKVYIKSIPFTRKILQPSDPGNSDLGGGGGLNLKSRMVIFGAKKRESMSVSFLDQILEIKQNNTHNSLFEKPF